MSIHEHVVLSVLKLWAPWALYLAGSSGPRIRRGMELGDGRHQEPRQASIVTYDFNFNPFYYINFYVHFN
jgi:hypothetical protein